MTTKTVAELLAGNTPLQDVTLKGWVRTFRANRFIAINDGSTINNMQCVVDFENFDEALLKRVTTGAKLGHKPELACVRRYRALDAANGDARPECHDDGDEADDAATTMTEIDMSKAGNQPSQECRDRHAND